MYNAKNQNKKIEKMRNRENCEFRILYFELAVLVPEKYGFIDEIVSQRRIVVYNR